MIHNLKREEKLKKKILHIIHGFGTGGAETWLVSLVKYLYDNPELNLHFDFLITGGRPLFYDEEVLKHGSNIYYIKYSMHSFFSFSKKFKKLLKENKYQVIHDHQDFISGWHFLAGLGALPPVRVSHLHNPYNFVLNYVTNNVRRFIFISGRILTLTLTTVITGTSDAVMDEYKYNRWPYSTKRKKPMYCGFDTKKFSFYPGAIDTIRGEFNWSATVKIGLFVGRIGLQTFDTAINQKNPEFAFELAKKLVNEHENWRFLFVGFKGDLGNRYEQIIDELGLGDRIKFLGIRNDIPAIMSACDILIFPSYCEGLGMVAVEAQSTGLPVIMSEQVPSEAIVCNELVKVKELMGGVDNWVNEIIQATSKATERSKYSMLVKHSPFSIENSILNLMNLYLKKI